MKINLTNVNSGYNLSAINTNFEKIEAVLNDSVLFRDDVAIEPNSMSVDLDMNGNRIFNLPVPVLDNEPLRKGDIGDLAGTLSQVEQLTIEAEKQAAKAAGYASSSQINSEIATQKAEEAVISAITAANEADSAEQAAVIAYSNSRLTAGTVTTGSPGSSASVSIDGSPGTQVISFTIPRGDVGETGATGPSGPSGSGSGDMLKSENLSGLASYSTARTNLGLGNVENTSDVNKPVSTAQALADTVVLNAASLDATSKSDAAQAASAPLAHASNTSNPHSVTKVQVGLSNVDNTSDVDKPVSTAQALADTAVLNAAASDATSKANAAAAASTPIAHSTNFSNPHATTKSQVGLSNVNNTSDVDKPISTATATALAGKQAAGTYVTPTTLNNGSLPASFTTLSASGDISATGGAGAITVSGSANPDCRAVSTGGITTILASVDSFSGGYVGTYTNHGVGIYTNDTKRIDVSSAGAVTIPGKTTIGGHLLFVTPEMYGAVGNNTGVGAANVDAFNAAIDAAMTLGVPLQLSSVTYYLASVLIINLFGRSITIKGNSQGGATNNKSTLFVASGTTGMWIYDSTSGTSINGHFSLQNFDFETDVTSNTSTVGLMIGHGSFTEFGPVDMCNVTNVSTHNFPLGILCEAVRHINFYNVCTRYGNNNGSIGLTLRTANTSGVHDLKFFGCEFSANPGTGTTAIAAQILSASNAGIGGIHFTDCDFYFGEKALLFISNTSTGIIGQVYLNNCQFDWDGTKNSEAAILIENTHVDGTVEDIGITGGWMYGFVSGIKSTNVNAAPSTGKGCNSIGIIGVDFGDIYAPVSLSYWKGFVIANNKLDNCGDGTANEFNAAVNLSSCNGGTITGNNHIAKRSQATSNLRRMVYSATSTNFVVVGNVAHNSTAGVNYLIGSTNYIDDHNVGYT